MYWLPILSDVRRVNYVHPRSFAIPQAELSSDSSARKEIQMTRDTIVFAFSEIAQPSEVVSFVDELRAEVGRRDGGTTELPLLLRDWASKVAGALGRRILSRYAADTNGTDEY